MTDKAVYRTAPATPGLLKNIDYNSIYHCHKNMKMSATIHSLEHTAINELERQRKGHVVGDEYSLKI